MPCNDWGSRDDHLYDEIAKANARITRLTKSLAKREAMLCAVLTILESEYVGENFTKLDRMFERIDWKEAGVSKGDLTKWWRTHKKQDEVRRERERKAEEAKREEARKLAEKERLMGEGLAKLTDEEREALGL